MTRSGTTSVTRCWSKSPAGSLAGFVLSDTLARYGGDEFVMLLEDLVNREAGS
jgi:hypothetical protein